MGENGTNLEVCVLRFTLIIFFCVCGSKSEGVCYVTLFMKQSIYRMVMVCLMGSCFCYLFLCFFGD